MSPPSHPLRSPEQWQQLIEQQARSGLTQTAFCASQGLAKTTFQHWKRRLKAASRAAVSAVAPEAIVYAAGCDEHTLARGRSWLDDRSGSRRWRVSAPAPWPCMRTPAPLWLCRQPTDMRRSYDGLAAMVRHHLGDNPLSGQGFVLVNRRRTQLKCLYFEAGGYCIWGKRLEQGRFGVNHGRDRPSVALSRTAFEALIEGLDVVVRQRRKRWQPSARKGHYRI